MLAERQVSNNKEGKGFRAAWMGEHLWVGGGRKKEKVGHKVTREKKSTRRRRKSKVWNAWKKGENKKGGKKKINGKENILYCTRGWFFLLDLSHFRLQATTIRTSIEY